MSDSDNEESEKTLKIVLLGDGTSGKTSLCTRFAQRNFSRKYAQTVGVDFFSRRITLPPDLTVLLQIWDVGGQSIAAEMLSKYVYGAHAILFVYDVTNVATFDSLPDWITTVKKITKQVEKPIHMAVVGNKTDMEHRRVVRIDKHSKFVEQYAMGSHYVSAKTGDTVDLMYRSVAAEVLGVQLSKTDMEWDMRVIEAPVAVLDADPRSSNAANRTGPPKPPSSIPQVTATPANSNKSRELSRQTNARTVNSSKSQSAVCSVQ
ncbi:small GTP binding protein RAB28 [Aphelenchoides avenae]|nr:small GTP binding protein RAB28 [Aphelenchus avenae]